MNLGRRRAPRTPPPPTRAERFAAMRLDAGDLDELATAFAPPHWLRDLGRSSWALVGSFLLVAGIGWLLGKTSTIVVPVLVGLIVATVAAPLVTLLARRVPRVLGALLVLLGFVVLTVLIALLVIGGITAQGESVAGYATAAAEKAQSWLESAGVDQSGSSGARTSVEQAVPQILSTLTHGVVHGIQGLASLAFGLSFAVFSLFFLLKDGPKLRAWTDRHLGVPQQIAHTITGDVVESIRRYFLGVSIVAAFNAVVVGVGALLLGVPLAGTIAVVTLVTAYVPFIGAVVSGAFAVVLALGSEGTSTALVMLVIVLLANGMLQNVVQPIAFGATLDLNPLLILVVTISAGSLFGMAGLVLAAPLTSAAVHIAADLAALRAAAGAPSAAPAPAAPV